MKLALPGFARRASRSGAYLTAAIASLVAVPMATAEAAPCPAGTPSALEIKAPTTVAYGRTFGAELIEASAEGWSANGVAASGTFSYRPALSEAVSPSTFAVPIPATFDPSSLPTSPLIVINRGEGPGVLTATWTQGIGGQPFSKQKDRTECEAATSVTVTPIRGALATVEPGYRYKDVSTFFDLRLKCPHGESEDISQTSTAPVTIRLSGGGQRTQLRYSDICEANGFQVRGRYWKFTEFAFESGSDYTHALVLIPRQLRGRSIRMHFDVHQAGETLAYGNFRIATQSEPGRFIYQGSDGFVNYCIDTGQELRSSSGKLNCFYPGRYKATVTNAHMFPQGQQ